MFLRTASIIRRETLFSRGRTLIPCSLCGKHYADRLRIVDDWAGKQRVTHVCIKNCLAKFTDSILDFSEAGKVRSNGTGDVVMCSYCGGSARGGLWIRKVSVFGLTGIGHHVVDSNSPYEVIFCPNCIDARLKSKKEEFIANNYSWRNS